MSRGFLVPTGDGILVKFRVSPGAKRTAIEGAYGEDALKLRVAAPPVNGRANDEVERFVAGMVGFPRSDVAVVRGVASRDKTVLVRGAAEEELRQALSGHLR